ncbi:hypothetical protein D7B24_001064 [Verticillium nonalfalfae]|uniref:lytic cellulose monooxygenase (C4-dehydrogenating) n=1 Tax=Verticillium nonalfalfae TaxID=1051616 RepID=A0A3M9YJ61_9PEZI|nr:uncharacterized protein D7B24_001064 [Verticillium nonalfalfae]RNJ59826.1 hypothetical protein D7B24_001064 [Verticillium nonalfalfae]
MRFTVASALAMATTVSAHAQMYGIWVNGVDQGDGRKDYIRSPPNNSPVKDLTSPDLVCGPNGGTPVPSFAKAAAGDKLSFEWYHDNRDDDIIDGSHEGPLITYIAEYTETDGSGPIWTKIAEDGYSGGKWAVDKIKANHGKQDFTLPAGLAAGKYLVRQEIIAHHESDVAFASNPARGAQFYPSCVQLEVTEGGSAVPDEGFDFNTGYTSADPGIVFNLYSGYTSYTIPGPKVWTGAGSGSAPAPKPTTAAPVATTTAAAPVAPTTTAAPVVPAPGNGSEDDSEGAPAPVFSSIASAAPVVPTTTAAYPVPTTTLATVVKPPSATNAPTTPPTTPPTTCKAKRSRSRKARRSAKKVARRAQL